MPTQKDIDEIAGYLKSFEDGTRKHDQEHYHSHCGTAHCLAGWKALDDAIADGVITDDWRDVRPPGGYAKSQSLDSWRERKKASHSGYARRAWSLTEHESDLLFLGSLSLPEMKENLRSIAASHGLSCPPFEEVPCTTK